MKPAGSTRRTSAARSSPPQRRIVAGAPPSTRTASAEKEIHHHFQTGQVWVFGPAGELLRAFGRLGSGPGDLGQEAVGLFVDRDGTILVVDMGNQRLVRFIPDGEPLPLIRLDLTGSIPMLLQNVGFEEQWPALVGLLPGPEGTLWVQRLDPEPAMDPAAIQDLQSFRAGTSDADVPLPFPHLASENHRIAGPPDPHQKPVGLDGAVLDALQHHCLPPVPAGPDPSVLGAPEVGRGIQQQDCFGRGVPGPQELDERGR